MAASILKKNSGFLRLFFRQASLSYGTSLKAFDDPVQDKTMKLETLKHALTRRLIKKHFTRHFRRLAILETLRGVPVAAEVPPPLWHLLTKSALQPPEELLARLNSHANGLDELEAKVRGPARLPEQAVESSASESK